MRRRMSSRYAMWGAVMVIPASRLWPAADTAFVVTHGNLSKDPFWVIDRFTHGLLAALEAANPGSKIELEHKLRRSRNAEGEWVESYVRLKRAGSAACIDIYEYYWDVYMVHPPSWASLRAWLGMLASNAVQLHLQPKEGEGPGRDPEYGSGMWFILLWGLAWLFSLILSPLALLAPERASKWLCFLPKAMARFASDTTTYLVNNVRSGDYRIRRQVLDGAVGQAASIMRDDRYGHVVLAGHSLGSVIMYDVINRLRRDACAPSTAEGSLLGGTTAERNADLGRLSAFVSFGSPLDKVAYFFHRRVPDDEDVRREILDHLHGFRRVRLREPVRILEAYRRSAARRLGMLGPDDASKAEQAPPGHSAGGATHPPKDPMCSAPLDGLRWLNFYHVHDGAAGHLDAYSPVENFRCTTPIGTRWPLVSMWRAHGSYWDSRPKPELESMYDIIVKELFAAAPEERAPEAFAAEALAAEAGAAEAGALQVQAHHAEFAI